MNEDLNRKATRFIRENTNVKGKAIMTAGMLCQWVNDDLLPNETLEPGRLDISITTDSGHMGRTFL